MCSKRTTNDDLSPLVCGWKKCHYLRKRFNVTSVTRDKEYDLTKGDKNSKVIYFSANPNSESEVVTVFRQMHRTYSITT